MQQLVKELKSAFLNGEQTGIVVSGSNMNAYYKGLKGVAVLVQTYLLNISQRSAEKISMNEFVLGYYNLLETLFENDEVPMVGRRFGDAAVLIANYEMLHINPFKKDDMQLWFLPGKPLTDTSISAVKAKEIVEGLYSDRRTNVVLIGLAEKARERTFESTLARRLYYMIGAAHVSASVARFKEQLSRPAPMARSKAAFIGDMRAELPRLHTSAKSYVVENVLNPQKSEITGIDPKVSVDFIINTFAAVPSSLNQFETIMQMIHGADEYLSMAKEATVHVGKMRNAALEGAIAHGLSLSQLHKGQHV
jgi:hypothetical protein